MIALKERNDYEERNETRKGKKEKKRNEMELHRDGILGLNQINRNRGRCYLYIWFEKDKKQKE